VSANPAVAGWYKDPDDHHEFRYHDGSQWTTLVADNGVTSEDDGSQEAPQMPEDRAAGNAGDVDPLLDEIERFGNACLQCYSELDEAEDAARKSLRARWAVENRPMAPTSVGIFTALANESADEFQAHLTLYSEARYVSGELYRSLTSQAAFSTVLQIATSRFGTDALGHILTAMDLMIEELGDTPATFVESIERIAEKAKNS